MPFVRQGAEPTHGRSHNRGSVDSEIVRWQVSAAVQELVQSVSFAHTATTEDSHRGFEGSGTRHAFDQPR
jgi:hypothetical protein